MVWLLPNNMLNKNQYQTKKMYIQEHVSNHCTLQTIIIRTIEQFNLTQKSQPKYPTHILHTKLSTKGTNHLHVSATAKTLVNQLLVPILK